MQTSLHGWPPSPAPPCRPCPTPCSPQPAMDGQAPDQAGHSHPARDQPAGLPRPRFNRFRLCSGGWQASARVQPLRSNAMPFWGVRDGGCRLGLICPGWEEHFRAMACRMPQAPMVLNNVCVQGVCRNMVVAGQKRWVGWRIASYLARVAGPPMTILRLTPGPCTCLLLCCSGWLWSLNPDNGEVWWGTQVCSVRTAGSRRLLFDSPSPRTALIIATAVPPPLPPPPDRARQRARRHHVWQRH